MVGADKAIFVNFNSGPGKLPQLILSKAVDDISRMLGEALLFSSGQFENESASGQFQKDCLQPDLDTAVQWIRKNLEMDQSAMLVILMDEFGKLDKLSGKVLRHVMSFMDDFCSKHGGCVTFVFSALVENAVTAWVGDSGRSFYKTSVELTCLSNFDLTMNALSTIFREDPKSQSLSLLKNDKIVLELRQCFGHPR